MFFKLEAGRNYAHIFFVMVGLTLLLGLIFGEKVGGTFFFFCFYYIGALQLRSGLTFNRSWTAQRRKDKNVSTTATWCFVIGTFGMILVLLQN